MGIPVHDKEEVLQQSLKIVKDESLTQLSELCTFLPVYRGTFYLPEWQDVKDEIQKALDDQKVLRKHKYRRRWADDNAAPVLQLAGYKLIADQDELERLTVNNNNTKHSGELAITWDEKRSYSDALIEGSTILQVQDSTQQQVNDTDNTNTAG